MDTNKQIQPIKTSCEFSGPAQLWIGTTQKLIDHAHSFMQQRWCVHGGCTRCTPCKLIEQHQFYGALWVQPDGNYSRDDLDIIFRTLQFALDENREMIIVIQRADYLTASCYNSLLKSIEEPPRGYHFLLLAERLDTVAPTIRSRCTITHFTPQYTDITQHPLAKFFINCHYENPSSFLQALDSVDPDEHMTAELIDSLLRYWLGEYKKSAVERNASKLTTIESIVNTIQQALEEPPMAGSSKLFWKNLLVQIKA